LKVHFGIGKLFFKELFRSAALFRAENHSVLFFVEAAFFFRRHFRMEENQAASLAAVDSPPAAIAEAISKGFKIYSGAQLAIHAACSLFP
jgi:hypothetical protein